jgi:PST family polysaccharide transporter
LKFIIALLATAALARLLTPVDFGLIGMAMAVIGFIAVFKDLGLSMATIQRADVSHNQVSTLFWINVGVSFVMMLFVASLAPLLAWYYKEPRVEQITLVLAGTVIFSGLIVQHQALLRRQMRFGALAMAEIMGIFTAFLSGIVAALAGLGYWSLVIIPVVREVVMMLGVWTFCRWRPGRPVRRSREGLSDAPAPHSADQQPHHRCRRPNAEPTANRDRALSGVLPARGLSHRVDRDAGSRISVRRGRQSRTDPVG